MNEQYYGMGLPIDISTHGHQIDKLFYSLHVFMLLLFVFWFCFLTYTLIKFRARAGHKATYKPQMGKWSSYLEIAVAVAEVLFLIILAFPAWKAAKTLRPSGPDVVNVRVIAEQFAWNIHYPGQDGVFGKTSYEQMNSDNPVGLDREDPNAKDDIITINQLHVPVNRPVMIRLSSKDVIHSFFVPVLRIKQDANPGLTYPVVFEAKQTGDFEIACAQLCGLGHYRMRGAISVKSNEDYEAWLKQTFEEQQSYQ